MVLQTDTAVASVGCQRIEMVDGMIAQVDTETASEGRPRTELAQINRQSLVTRSRACRVLPV